MDDAEGDMMEAFVNYVFDTSIVKKFTEKLHSTFIDLDKATKQVKDLEVKNKEVTNIEVNDIQLKKNEEELVVAKEKNKRIRNTT